MSKAHTGSKFRSLLATIRKHFKPLDIVIKTKKIVGLEVNEFYINAFYDLDADKNNECSIEVIIYHDIDTDMFFEHSQVGQFLVQLYDAVVHELQHQQQGRKRIDAYALSIAIELIRNLGRTRSIQYLHRASRLANIRPKGLYASPNLFAYFETFERLDHPVIRKLLKKVFLNLETVDKMSVFY